MDDLGVALRVALASGKAVGIEITIYNPRLDEDGSAGRGRRRTRRSARNSSTLNTASNVSQL